jgi:hypothetical protein
MIMIARKISLLRRFLLAATLASGFGTVWLVVTTWVGSSIIEAWPGEIWPPREELVVAPDGTPLIASTPHENLSLTTYRELGGRAHDPIDREEMLPALYMPGDHEAIGVIFSPLGWELRLKVFVDEREPNTDWYFVHDGKAQGSGYFVGYERVSNRRIGFIGLSGFRSHAVPPDEWIPVRGEVFRDYSFWSSAPVSIRTGRGWFVRLDRWDLPPRLVYVPSGDRLRLVDLAARTVVTVFEAPEPIESVGVPPLASYSTGHLTRARPILVRTTQKIYALDHKHKVIREFTIPGDIDRRSSVSWFEPGNGQAIADFVRPRSTAEADNVTKRTVYRIADDGQIENTLELTLHTGSRVTDQQKQNVLLAVGLPCPLIQVAIAPLFAVAIDRQGYPAAVSTMFKEFWPSVVAVLALSAVLAAIAWRRSRGFGLGRRDQTIWAVFVLLFGFPAYVGFLLHRLWPTRVRCPNCQTLAARDRALCTECGTRFPDPSPKGIEIFA